MADNPLAIRVSEDVKALFNELAEQGEFENKGEFLNRLLVMYQSESTKKEVSIMRPAIETVEILMTRLIETLTGTAAAIATKEENQKIELDEQKKSFEDTRTLLQQRITSLEQDRAADEEQMQLYNEEKEAAEGKISELQQQVKQLEVSVNDKAALVEEYKAKNDNLAGIISEYKESVLENKKLSDEVNILKQENTSLQQRLDDLNQKLQQQTDGFMLEKENLKKSFLLDKDTSLLGLRMEHQQQTQKQQELYAEKVKELLDKLEASHAVSSKSKNTVANKKMDADVNSK